MSRIAEVDEPRDNAREANGDPERDDNGDGPPSLQPRLLAGEQYFSN